MRFGSASFSVMGDLRQDFIAEPVAGAVSTPSRGESNSTAVLSILPLTDPTVRNYRSGLLRYDSPRYADVASID
jgi:hypothetical protein